MVRCLQKAKIVSDQTIKPHKGAVKAELKSKAEAKVKTEAKVKAEVFDKIAMDKGPAEDVHKDKVKKYRRRVEKEIQHFGRLTCPMGSFKPFDRQVKSILAELRPGLRIERGAVEKLQLACEALIENFIKSRHQVRSLPCLQVLAESLPEDLRRTLLDPKTKPPVLKGKRSIP